MKSVDTRQSALAALAGDPQADLYLKVYNSERIVSHYAKHAVGWQPAEQVMFDELGSKLVGWDVLDLGIGTGRTSAMLIPRVKSYTGLDYAPRMIEECRKRFESSDRVRFMHADARDLAASAGLTGQGLFDIVVFAFNGIDSVDARGRARVLAEVRRVLKPGGTFVFSSHNLAFDLRQSHSIRFSRNPRWTLQSISAWAKFRLRNRDYDQVLRAGRGALIDGAEGFTVANFYIRASLARHELEGAGFGGVRVWGCHSGRELSVGEADSVQEPWLYYRAEAV